MLVPGGGIRTSNHPLKRRRNPRLRIRPTRLRSIVVWLRGQDSNPDLLVQSQAWSVDGAVDFRDAVLWAANLGDDADTTAAIAGQLAGARWGASAIPAAWREKVVAGERIVSLARGLFVAGGGETDAGGWAHDPFVHAWWVQPGQLLAGEYPGHPSPTRARQKVDLLVDAGVRTFVDLTTPADRLEPYEAVVAEVGAMRGLDVRRLSFPIPDLSVVDDDGYDEVCQAIEDGRRRGVVYVHCWGVGRTATVIGCVLAGEGLSHDQIVDRLVALRKGSRKARRAPETSVQHDLIRRSVARRLRLSGSETVPPLATRSSGE